MSKIQIIMFDLSEVLIRGLVGIEGEISQILNQPRDTILSKFNGDGLIKLCHGEITEDEYLSHIRQSNSINIAIEDLKRIIRQNFHHEVAGMISLLKTLSEHYPLILISDHAKEWIDYIEEIHPFMQLFQEKVYSFETKKLKDDPSCFPSLLTALKLEGEKCLFTDDRLQNIENARRAGINAVHFNDRQQFESELCNLGVIEK